MISKSVLIIPFGLAKAKSRQAESHMSYPVCTIIGTIKSQARTLPHNIISRAGRNTLKEATGHLSI